MSEWPIKSVGDLATFHRGITWASFQETDKPEPDCVPVLRIPNVQERLDTTSILFLRGISQEKRCRFAATRNWLLMVGSNGNPNRVGDCVRITHDTDYLFASFLVGVEPNLSEGVDPCFLQYLLRSESVRKAVSDSIKGTTGLRNISLSHLAAHELRCPPPLEQRKIAKILTTLDNLIDKTESLIAKYETIKQGMMQDLFARGMDAYGHLRPPYTEAPNHYKESELGWIPKEWEEGTIDTYCDIHNHLRLPISSEQREQMQGEYPYYGPTGIFDWLDHYRVDGEYALIGEDGDHFLKFATQPMTILGRGKYNVNNHAHLLKGKHGCSTEWVFAFYCHRDIKAHLTHQGAGRLKLNKASLRAMPLVVPQPSEQAGICERFRSVNSRISTDHRQLIKLLRLKSGLMQDLLTGTVRVTVDEAQEVADD